MSTVDSILTENEKWPFSVHVVAFSVFALYGILTAFSLNIALSLQSIDWGP